jgi:hypothetical protein
MSEESKPVTLKDGRYYDSDNNSWSAKLFTEAQAIKFSGSMVNCSSCRDCSYCHHCISCRHSHHCISCSSCSSCSHCHACHHCSECRACISCSEFEENPERITSPKIGTRKGNTTYYWTDKKEIIVCGCFTGSMDDFELRVKETHGDNEHGTAYKSWIKRVKNYLNCEVTK